MIKLSDLSQEQLDALEFIKDFIDSDKVIATIQGKAGTGKTTIMKFAILWLEQNFRYYELIAPTNKAAEVLNSSTQREVTTIHKLLGLKPIIDIVDLDLKDLKFAKVFNDSLFSKIIICDEGSMVNDVLYDFLKEQCEKNNCKIIYLLDEAQLAPVEKDSNELSKTTKCKNTFKLTKIFRQHKENILMPLLENLRVRNITKFPEIISDTSELRIFISKKEFALDFLVRIHKEVKTSQLLKSKILCFTNKQVNEYNRYCHTALFRKKENKEDWFIGEPVLFRVTKEKLNIINGNDGVLTAVEPTMIDIPDIGEYPGYKIQCLKNDNTYSEFNVLKSDISQEDLQNIGNMIEAYRLDAIHSKNNIERKKLWANYYKIVDSFLTPRDIYVDGRLIKKQELAYGYAMTVHYSQGSTYENVYVDVKDIDQCSDKDFCRRLKYVAFSRTKNNAYVYTGNNSA